MAYNDDFQLLRHATQFIYRSALSSFTSTPKDGTHRSYKSASSVCHFLHLDLDIRYQIYKELLRDPQEVWVIDFGNFEQLGSEDLISLMSTNRAIRDEILAWYAQNTYWLTRDGLCQGLIHVTPTVHNTKYLFRWTSDFGRSPRPAAGERWHQFCYNFWSGAAGELGPLVIELHLRSFKEVIVAIKNLFAEVYRMEARKIAEGDWVGPPRINIYLTSIELVLHLPVDGPRPDWDHRIRKAMRILWSKTHCDFYATECPHVGCDRRCVHKCPELSWSFVKSPSTSYDELLKRLPSRRTCIAMVPGACIGTVLGSVLVAVLMKMGW